MNEFKIIESNATQAAFKRNLLRAVLGTVAGLALLIVSACAGGAGNDSSNDKILIGGFTALTGDLAPLGKDMQRGTELAVKEYGDIHGKDVEIKFEDTQGDPDTGLSKAQKLVQKDEVDVLTGGASSAVVLGIAAQSERLDVPIVSTNSQAVETTGEQCDRYLFRTNPNDAMMANANAIMLGENPDIKNSDWFVVYHDQVWGKSNKAQFEKIDGVNIVGEAGRPFGTADWSSVIQKIQSTKPDAIYLALAVGNDIPNFIKQARSFGLKQVMLPPLGMPDSMLNMLKQDALGLRTGGLFATWMTEESNDKMKKFVKTYYDEYDTAPGPQAIQAYSGTWLTLEAMDKAESLDSDDIIKSLESVKVDSILGRTSIRPYDHQGRVGLFSAEAVKLEEPKYGVQYGWKPINHISWDDVKVAPEDTGCSGLDK